MSDITKDADRTAENCAEHFGITTMMHMPADIDSPSFVRLVADKFKAKCDEKVAEQARRATLQGI